MGDDVPILPDFKNGEIVIHLLSDRQMIVLAVSSDLMVNCRYLDGNSIFQSQWFYPNEVVKFIQKDSKTGFGNGG